MVGMMIFQWAMNVQMDLYTMCGSIIPPHMGSTNVEVYCMFWASLGLLDE